MKEKNAFESSPGGTSHSRSVNFYKPPKKLVKFNNTYENQFHEFFVFLILYSITFYFSSVNNTIMMILWKLMTTKILIWKLLTEHRVWGTVV